MATLETRTHARKSRPSRISRRAVAKGAVWAAPAAVVASSAPAFAASSCDPQEYEANFEVGNYARQSTSLGGGVAFSSGDGDDLTYEVTSTLIGNATHQSSNLQRLDASVLAAGLTGQVLDIFQTAVRGAGQEVTFTFSRPVENLIFTLADVDPNGAAPGVTGFRDSVSISPIPSGVSFADPTYLEGVGSEASPIQPRTGMPTSQPTESRGNATVTLTGPVTTVAV